MKYDDFKKKVEKVPVLSGRFLMLLADDDRSFLVQLNRWVRAGKVVRLRKGLYILNEGDRKIFPSRLFIACELYNPSYVSMEYALSFYGLIPERVADITAITTKKTAVFNNDFGRFVYQHIKTECFTGFQEMKDEAGLGYLLAVPEKALVDFLYLNLHKFMYDYQKVARESFRLQNVETLDGRKIIMYAELFSSKKLLDVVKIFTEKGK